MLAVYYVRKYTFVLTVTYYSMFVETGRNFDSSASENSFHFILKLNINIIFFSNEHILMCISMMFI